MPYKIKVFQNGNWYLVDESFTLRSALKIASNIVKSKKISENEVKIFLDGSEVLV